MTEPTITYVSTKISEFFIKLCKLVSIVGCPNFWLEPFKSPFLITPKVLPVFRTLLHASMILTLIAQWPSFITQKDLKDKQKSDLPLFCTVCTLFYTFYSLVAYKANIIRRIIRTLVKLKEIYNDPQVETEMIKRTLFFLKTNTFMYVLILIMYGVDGLNNALMGK